MSPTAVQGRADIRMRVAMPLDYERIRTYSFSVSFPTYECSYRHLNIYVGEDGFNSQRLYENNHTV